jgi:AAA domain
MRDDARPFGDDRDIDGLGHAAHAFRNRNRAERRKRGARPNGEDASAERFKLVDWNDIIFDPNDEWRIEDILPLRGLGLVYGKQGSFKSFVAMNLALHVALGTAWAGKRVERGRIVYIAAEGGPGMPKRLAPHKAKHTMQRGQFALLSATPNLGAREGDLPALITAVKITGVHPALIVIDTAAAAIGGADENGAGMAALIDNARRLAQHFDCFVLVVHHVGHDDTAQKRPRGWSGLGPALDVQILCERQEREMRTILTVQKQKEEADGICFEARLSRVVIATAENGKETSTLVVDSVRKADPGAAPKTDKRPEGTILRHELLDAYDRLAANVEHSHGLDFKSVRKVRVNAIRDDLKERGLIDMDDETLVITPTGRTRFRRAKSELIGSKTLIEHKALIWRPV